jgi:succinate dehydrogenase / fumarate reductase, cytochrome b subunit
MKHLSSSVVKKQIMGVTGLLLCGFLISHLIGNCLIYVSPQAFNTYAHALITNPLIYVAEVILASIFLTHIFLAFKLTLENKQARPEKYFIRQKTGRGATFASSTMPYTGVITLIFLVIHIMNFKFGAVYTATYDGVEMRDLAKLMFEYFSSPLNVGWYIFAMISLGIHVSHGFWSAFQSIGFNHPKYNCLIKGISTLYAVVITLGFSALPIYCYTQGGM